MRSASLEHVRGLLDQARAIYGDSLETTARIEALRRRADEPLRVALIGTVKAGKSTLVNALLGEQLAPTDARECTRIVTWYRHGNAPSVRARHSTEGEIQIRTLRQGDRLELDLGHLDANEIEWLDVTWPAAPLEEFTLIDTPGMASVSTEVGERTIEFVAPDGGVTVADAFVYLLRSLHAHDVEFLRTLGDRSGGDTSMGSIAVLSRADELGAGRLNAMAVANKAVDRLRDDPTLEAACETVVPVAGLLALAGQSLRQSEFAQLEKLAALPPDRLSALMVSTDRFVSTESDDLPSPRDRTSLIHRLGLFGIRLALAVIQMGVADATTLADELVRHSGLDELKRVIDVLCRGRHPQLKAHSVLLGLQQVFADQPVPEAAQLAETVDELLADPHPFQEMKLLGRVNSSRISLRSDDRAEMERLLGGSGITASERLGVAEDLRHHALEALWKWRDYAANPFVDSDTADACRVTARTCEWIIAGLTASTPVG
ncbi:dynamin family protein [Aeromicrobium sp.]|uniref:dynamin family protein n=1 Tax=Aeromicrobium sp. TaxID=1871063 RepID=UPI003C4C9ACF